MDRNIYAEIYVYILNYIYTEKVKQKKNIYIYIYN